MQDSGCPRPAGPGSAPHKPQGPRDALLHTMRETQETGPVAHNPTTFSAPLYPFPRVQLPHQQLTITSFSLNVCFRRPHLRQG